MICYQLSVNLNRPESKFESQETRVQSAFTSLTLCKFQSCKQNVMLVGVLLDCHVRQNCFQLGLNCCFPIFDNGELHIPFHLWLDFRLPSHLTMGCHFCQNCHIPMTQLLLILRQKEHYPLLYFFIQNSMPHTRTPDIEPINVAYLGAARRSYNVSKKTGVFSRFYRANLLLSYNCGGS